MNKQDVNILVGATDDMTGAPDFSGVAEVECSNTDDNADFKPCTSVRTAGSSRPAPG